MTVRAFPAGATANRPRGFAYRPSERAMTRRWISLVPSPMRSIRTTRQMRSTGPSASMTMLQSRKGADLYKVHVASRKVVPLTTQQRTPNTGALPAGVESHHEAGGEAALAA